MAPAILFLLSTLALFTSPSLAVPNVTAVLIPDCSAFPSDGFIPILNQCDNSTIEGYGDDVQLIRHTGDTGITSGRITIASNNSFAKYAFRCNPTLYPGSLEALTPSGVSGYAWNQVNLSYYPYDAELGWGFGQYSTPVEAYYHFVDDVQQPGVFLGSNGTTTWAVKYESEIDSDTVDGLPYWDLRFLGYDSGIPWLPGTPQLDVGEYETFLMVSG